MVYYSSPYASHEELKKGVRLNDLNLSTYGSFVGRQMRSYRNIAKI